MTDIRWAKVWAFIKPFDPLDLNNMPPVEIEYGPDPREGKVQVFVEVSFDGWYFYSMVHIDTDVPDEIFEWAVKESLDALVERIDDAMLEKNIPPYEIQGVENGAQA
jgi:hypothetical protein